MLHIPRRKSNWAMSQEVIREEDNHFRQRDGVCRGDVSEGLTWSRDMNMSAENKVSREDRQPGQDLEEEHPRKEEWQIPSPCGRNRLSLSKGQKDDQNYQSISPVAPGEGRSQQQGGSWWQTADHMWAWTGFHLHDHICTEVSPPHSKPGTFHISKLSIPSFMNTFHVISSSGN